MQTAALATLTFGSIVVILACYAGAFFVFQENKVLGIVYFVIPMLGGTYLLGNVKRHRIPALVLLGGLVLLGVGIALAANP